MPDLPEESQEFLRMVEELEGLLQDKKLKGKKAVLAAAARRFEIEHKLIKLLSPYGRSEERRRNVRVPCALPVVLKVGGQMQATAIDLSFGGARLSGNLPLQLGQLVELTLSPQPELLEHGLKTLGKVVWVREGMFGVFFASDDPAFARRILLLVLALLKKAAGTPKP